MERAAIYTRVSSEEQVKGNSLDEQENKGRYYIKAKDGVVVDIYQDGGKGGENTNRPELNRLMSDAKEKKFDSVVVYKMDRLSRNTRDFKNLQAYFENLGVNIVSITEDFDTGTPQGKLFIGMLGEFAEFERAMIRDRIVMGQVASLKKGNWKGMAPYGYDIKDKKLVINNKEAEVVKKVFKMFADNCFEQERLTLMKAQKIVNSWNVPTKRAYDKRYKQSDPNFWNASTICTMLKKEIYTGKTYVRRFTYNKDKKRITRPRDQWIKQTAPRVISDDTFKKTQLSLKRNSEFALRRGKGYDIMLGKKIVCSKCGRKYTYYNNVSQKGIIYYCQRTKHYRADKENRCDSKQFVAHRLEEPVWARLLEMLLNSRVLKKHIDTQLKKNSNGNSSQKIKELNKTLAKLKRNKDRLLDLYLSTDIDRSDYKSKINQLNCEEDYITKEINNLNQEKLVREEVKKKSLDFNKLYKRLKVNLENTTYADKTKLAQLLVDKVETDGAGYAKVWCILPKEVVMQTNQRISIRPSRR